MKNIIEIKHLKKYYGEVKAVDDITFNVEQGSLFAFLGINGAGKSTTINILCTLLDKDLGSVIIAGHDLDTEADAIKHKIGIVFQETVLDGSLKVLDNLKCRASYYGIRGEAWKARCSELIKMFDLSSIMNRRYCKLSGGQKRRVDIARGLINKPKLLFLDEPTTGLDPKTRQSIWDIIYSLQSSEGMTIFLTTHYMEEANNADRVVIINQGKIIADDTPAKLKTKFSGDYIKWYTSDSEEISSILDYEKMEYTYNSNCYIISVNNIKEAKEFIAKYDALLVDFELIKGNMDDVFLKATGVALEV